MGQNNQKYRLKYWATRSSVRTAHSFVCSALFASLAHSAVLTLSLTLLTPPLVGQWMIRWLFIVFFSILYHSVYPRPPTSYERKNFNFYLLFVSVLISTPLASAFSNFRDKAKNCFFYFLSNRETTIFAAVNNAPFPP